MSPETSDSQPRHPIQVVARRTGLTPDVLRAWERRYRVVEPERTKSQRRLYSDADIERLILLRKATQAGRSIGQLASLSDRQLEQLVAGDLAAQVAESGPPPSSSAEASTVLEQALGAVRNLDASRLQSVITSASLVVSPPELVDRVLVPLMRSIGAEWLDGTLGIAHEHLASAIVRAELSELVRPRQLPADAPALVVGTPAQQVHELGALVVAATAAADGWRVVYVGADLPAAELAAAAARSEARAVAISITYPPDDEHLPAELLELRQELPSGTAILVGGAGASSYVESLAEIGAILVGDLQGLRSILASLAYENGGAAA
jgi:DNA-binding transcriptional MerR regulator/methylmalonyl-CoA mutase cobalamin-binding subunit